MNSDEIIPWGFSETAGKISIKRDYLISLRFSSLEAFLQLYPSTFLCHADFIPDRSCLDVPVGRKCSACNGLTPEFLHELQYISEAFPPHYLSTVARHLEEKTLKNWLYKQRMFKNTNQVFTAFDGLEMAYYKRHYQRNSIKDVMTS